MNYNFYLAKNCKLPSEWKETIRPRVMKMIQDPVTKGQAYKELFSYSTEMKDVANFLSEVLYKVMPDFFMPKSCKNRKVLNKKILTFVKQNRYESYTRITLID